MCMWVEDRRIAEVGVGAEPGMLVVDAGTEALLGKHLHLSVQNMALFRAFVG